MEASGHARWFERLLAELQFELWIGDAAEIPVLPAWYPNLRKVILQHESQNQLCILSIGLLFAHSFALDLRVCLESESEPDASLTLLLPLPFYRGEMPLA